MIKNINIVKIIFSLIVLKILEQIFKGFQIIFYGQCVFFVPRLFQIVLVKINTNLFLYETLKNVDNFSFRTIHQSDCGWYRILV